MSAKLDTPIGRATMQAMGAAVAHDSAELHVKGAARYVDDIAEPRGTVHIAPGYCPDVAHGAISGVDLTAVTESDGVITVLTAADIPGANNCSPSLGDDRILAEKYIEFHGQVVFAVVAESRDQARRAARKATFDVEPQSPVVSIEHAIRADDDVLPPYAFVRGDANSALAASPRQLANFLEMGSQDHFYLEGQVSLAVPGDGDHLTVYSSTQHPSEIQHTIARMLARADADVVCQCRRMGGAFGGKESQAAQWACLAALAAKVTGLPAKLRLDRDDDMRMTGKRHDFMVEYRCGFDDLGSVRAVDVLLNGRCGNSADLSLGVNDRAMFHADNAYYYPHVRINSRRLKTNTVSSTAFRGFGGPQGMLFAEHMMDTIAIHCGLDALTVRKRNLYAPGRDITPYGMQVQDNIVLQVIEQLEMSSDYWARREEISGFNQASPIIKKGLALTPVKFGIAFTLKHLNQAGALVHVYTDGSVHVNHGGTEMGQGLFVKVAQVVADELGVTMDRVRVSATRTDKVPNTTATAASSGSDLNAMAAKRAASAIKDRLAELLSRIHHVERGEITFFDNKVLIGGKQIEFSQAANTAFLERVSLSATGFYATPKITWNRDQSSGQPFLYFAYGAACSEVSIDTLTGELRVDRVDIVHDVGRSLNPAVDQGQIEGGFVQGMGWLTSEEVVYDENGQLRTHAPSTYKIPTCSDVPDDFRVTLFASEGNQENTIYRSKAVGEPPLMLAISVYSAIFNAIASLGEGRVPELRAPATPESIMNAVLAMRAG